MPRLTKKEFDFYYLIICSRGPGSETIVVRSVERRKIKGPLTSDIMPVEEQLEKFGVTEVVQEWNDEGPILAIPASASIPLDKIYKWLVWDNSRENDLPDELEPDLQKILREVDAAHKEAGQAVLSAKLRAFLSPGLWTSCNSWRKLDLEIPSVAQFEQLMKATGQTAAELGKWNCKVMQEAAKRYTAGELTDEDFSGC